jgi:maltose/maltodextrin transport system substrate-binding protein/arabinogalactan oligomer/maltooligosaccharide transport system substrate-binding protein
MKEIDMRKSFLLVAVALLLVLSAAVPALAQDAKPDLLIWADNTRVPALTPIVEQFSEEFGVTVQVQEIGMGDIRSNITVAGPAGEGPDVFVAASDWVGELVQNGAIIPIDLGDIASEFTAASLNLFTYNGELYAMPYSADNVAFFRNPDLVPDAPATWDDVKAITEELVSSGKSKYGYMIQTNDPYHYFPIMSAFGGYIFGQDDQGNYTSQDVGIDSEGSIAAGEWLKSMADQGFLVPAVGYNEMHDMFERGEAAMIMTGPWALNRIRTSGVKYAISDIPAGPAGVGKPLVGGNGFMISAYIDDNRRLVAESFLLDFMAAEEPMKAMYDADPRAPAFIKTLEALEDADLQAFQHAGEVGVPMPQIPEMTSVWGAWGNAEQFVITGELSPAEAFKNAAEQIRTLIAGGDVPVALPSAGGDAPPADGPQTVSIPGSLQAAVGCAADWAPDCDKTQLLYSANSDVWMNTFTVPAGDFEYKVAMNNSWDENYGGAADLDGANVKLSLAEETSVLFIYDNKTNWVADNVNRLILSVPGSFQSKIGCSADWAPDCLRSWLQDPDGDGVYVFMTVAIPAGDYEAKVAANLSWDLNYGVDGKENGDNLKFTVPADGTEVTFSFDSASKVLTISTGS